MTRNTTLAALIAAAGIATAGSLAYAAQGGAGENDALAALGQAKVTIGQAITAAEQQHAGGKATKAELEMKKGAAIYEVEVVAPDRQVFDVKVSAVDGRVLSSQLDKADRENDEKDDD